MQQEGRLTGDTKDLLEKLDEDPKKKEEKEVLTLSVIISSIKIVTLFVLQRMQNLGRRFGNSKMHLSLPSSGLGCCPV